MCRASRTYLFLLTMLCLLIILPAFAQDDDDSPEYRLREPTVEEYMQAIPPFIDGIEGDYLEYSNIAFLVVYEFGYLFPDQDLSQLPFDVLRDFQRSLGIGANRLLWVDLEEWHMMVFEAGLRDEGIIEFPSEFSFEDFTINTTEADFDGNGISEYLLSIMDGFSAREFYALINENFELFAVPLPFLGLLVSQGMPEEGRLTTRLIDDVDDDGGTEWIVEGDLYGYWAECGDLYVLDWDGLSLVDRTQGRMNFCIPLTEQSTSLVEFDYSQADNIYMREIRVDTWLCERERRVTLDLVANTLETTTIYEDTVWCDLREASEAFDVRNYTVSAELYADAIVELDGEMQQYLYARLALSYALNNRMDEAQTTLNAIESNGQMGELVRRLQDTTDDSLSMCLSAYTFFDEINQTREDQYDNPYEWTPEGFYFGAHNQDPRLYPLPRPSQAGCDYQTIFEIEPTPFPTLPLFTESPPIIPECYTVYPELLFDLNYDNTLQDTDDDLIGDFLEDTRIWLESDPQCTDTDIFSIRYLRALILERLDRPNDALADYIAIYDSAPESAWGMLAGLHLELIE